MEEFLLPERCLGFIEPPIIKGLALMEPAMVFKSASTPTASPAIRYGY
jgi:hypothetical protein